MTAPLQVTLSRLLPSAKRLARRIARALYWAATPWNMPARIEFLRNRARQKMAAEMPYQEEDHQCVEHSTTMQPISPQDKREGLEETPRPQLPSAASPTVQAAEALPTLPEAEEAEPQRLAARPTESKLASPGLRELIERSGLFDPDIYLSINEDLRAGGTDPWAHFLEHGIRERRRFTTPEIVARALSRLDPEIDAASRAVRRALLCEGAEDAIRVAAAPFVAHGVKIGVYCNSQANFWMQEIANLVQWQLKALKIDAQLRTEESDIDEDFDLRIFVAPHEFFRFGAGENWKRLAGAAGSVIFNTEQLQTHWFSWAFPFVIEAPLILDLNIQSAVLLRQMGCNALQYMPPYLPGCGYTAPQLDVSRIELVRGYAFSENEFDWTAQASLSDRPIDLLWVGTGNERRLKAIERLRRLSDKYRFVCVYGHQDWPLTSANHQTTSPEICCALSQRSKIVLNIHRDWLGYFEWSRMVMRGFWQGACVVSDPGLPDPLFSPGRHFLEENVRHMPELVDWLLGTAEGRAKIDEIGAAGHARAIEARPAMLVPMLNSLRELAGISERPDEAF